MTGIDLHEPAPIAVPLYRWIVHHSLRYRGQDVVFRADPTPITGEQHQSMYVPSMVPDDMFFSVVASSEAHAREKAQALWRSIVMEGEIFQDSRWDHDPDFEVRSVRLEVTDGRD